MADEDLEAQFGGDEPESEPEGGGEGEGLGSIPPPSGRFTIRGQEYGEDDLAPLLEFQDWAKSHPDQMYAFGQYLRGEAQFVPAGKPKPEPEPEPEPEIDWDMVDPQLRNVYQAQQARLDSLQSRLDEFQGPMQQIAQQQYQQMQTVAQAALDEASGTFMERHKLTNDELDELAEDAARLNIVPQLRQQGMDPKTAIETALETAYWQNDKWRQRAVDEAVASRGAKNRRENASQITGTSGASGDGLGSSTPATEAERRTAMVAEIAESMRGTP